MIAPPEEPGWNVLASELGTGDAGLSTDVAAAAARALEKLAKHFSRIIGEVGIRILFDRSVLAARVRFPWIAKPSPQGDPPWSLLHATLAKQDADEAARAFVALLSSFSALMGRFIGDALVAQLLHEVWPEVFPQAVKEPT